jgi:hypothetical protein
MGSTAYRNAFFAWCGFFNNGILKGHNHLAGSRGTIFFRTCGSPHESQLLSNKTTFDIFFQNKENAF